jgi:tRNA A-37 threonylcarbamoyl transferase component Bud32
MIRLILIEYVQGRTMVQIDPQKLDEKERDHLLIKAAEAELEIYAHGVYHRDFALRNVILCGDDLFSDNVRLVLIDFNIAHIIRYSTRKPSKFPSGLTISPIDFFQSTMSEFAE